MTIEYEPLAESWRDDPYPVYRELRDHDPVHWAPEGGVWCVSRYEDVLSVLRQPEIFSSRAMFTMVMNGGREEPPSLWSRETLGFLLRYAFRTRMSPLGFDKARNLIAEDAPVHGPLRNLVNRGFTPRRISAWEGRAREIVDEQMQKLRRGDAFDVVHDLAIPLPVTVIAEMIGVEPERIGDFKRWSDQIIEGATGGERSEYLFPPGLVDALIELSVYLRGIIKHRRRHPADDLISTIVAKDPGGKPLSDLEVVLFVQLLLVAGNETTTNLIGNAVHALYQHPDQIERVCGDPSLVPGLVEEALRYDTPVQMVFRTTTRATEIAGTAIPAGAQVCVMLGSANRDERRFENADVLDVTRDTRGHLGFGFGNHFCLGASLARLEAKAALAALVPELPRLRPPGEAREFIDSYLVRGARRLELRPAA